MERSLQLNDELSFLLISLLQRKKLEAIFGMEFFSVSAEWRSLNLNNSRDKMILYKGWTN